MFRISSGLFALCVPLLFSCVQGQAQTPDIGVIRAFPEPVSVNNTLTYTITLTNTHDFTVTDLNVIDTLPTPALLLSASSVPSSTISSNASTVTFQFPALSVGATATMTITVRPTAVGKATNTVVVTEFGLQNTPTTLVSTVVPESADLAINMTLPATNVILNDYVSYTLTLTNRGPGAAPSVVLSNIFSSSVLLRGLSPSNGVTFDGSNLRVNVGTLTSGSGITYRATVQPTMAGALTVTASVGSTAVSDPATADNSKTTTLNVIAPITNQLVATFATEQQFDAQTGLMEQIVTLTNPSTSNVPSARVVVEGLTGRNRLYNAVGTNDGNPFVVYATNLAAGASVDLVFEYFFPGRQPVEGLSLIAYGVPAPDLRPQTGTSPVITVITNLLPNGILIEFQAEIGRSYEIQYSDNASFANPLIAQPAITAPADRVQWIDNGPPKTISPVTNNATRFYRVIAR